MQKNQIRIHNRAKVIATPKGVLILLPDETTIALTAELAEKVGVALADLSKLSQKISDEPDLIPGTQEPDPICKGFSFLPN